MGFLVLSIICSTVISFIFKSFDHFKVDNFQAIVINYFICVGCAWVMLGSFPIESNIWQQPYFLHGIAMGFLFISGFNAIAITVQKFGITIGAVLQKMSIIFSAGFAIWMYNESLNVWKVIGIAAAILAIWFVNIQSEEKRSALSRESKWIWLVPIFTLLAASVIEIMLQYAELRLLNSSGDPHFVAFLFGTAGFLGALFLIPAILQGKLTWRPINLLAGVVLGVANYGSIYFLMRALGMGWEGSVVFPLNNVAVISLSAFFAYLLLNEKLSRINLAGLGLALMAILMITLSANF